ncbi:hypothetical protein ANN_09605 [Periplaneta americana]|uniref:Uncharacterized protein n=1 Tax=Periplaneta americana TaxID=6978 RepID=A0ABQ8TLS2_PERAM|nr:hypothetical protein ANN_09605 [Periplaneta americana]
MAGLCESGNEPPGSVKAILNLDRTEERKKLHALGLADQGQDPERILAFTLTYRRMNARTRRNIWRNVKMRLIDIKRQEIEFQCSEKSSLHLQSDVRCDYINSCNKNSRAGLAWLRLGAWKCNKIVNEEGERLCPLCREKDSYRHILLQCVELEQVRRKYLPPSMLSQNRSSLACLDLMGNREYEQKTDCFS